MSKIKPNYFAIIPAEVRYDNNLTPNAKLLYAEITSLLQMNGQCHATSDYFAEIYGVSRVAIQKWLKQLEENQYIERHTKRQNAENLKEIRWITIVNKVSKQKLTNPSKQKLTVINNLTDSNNNKTKVLDEEVKIFWNKLAKENNLPTIQAITPSRKKHLLARVKEVKDFEEFKSLLELNIKNSSFLKGENNRNWKVDFDWILNPTNFIKIIEGKYTNSKNNSSQDVNNDVDYELLAKLQGKK